MIEYGTNIIITGVITFTLTSFGYGVNRLINVFPASIFLRLTQGFAFGTITASFITYALGWVALLNNNYLTVVFVLLFIIGLSGMKQYLTDLKNISRQFHRYLINQFLTTKNLLLTNWFNAFGLTLIGVNLFILAAVAFTPPVGWDGLNYHLSVPKIYLQQEKITNLPTIQHSHFPLPIQFLNTFIISIGNETATQSMQVMFFIGVLLLMMYLLQELWPRISPSISLSSYLILFSIPVVLFSVPEAHVDIATAFYVLLSLSILIEYAKDLYLNTLLSAVIFISYASATKLTNLPFVFIFVFIIWLANRNRNLAAPAVMWLVLAPIAIITALPWYLKTWIYTGNPFWPFFLSVFPTKYPGNAYVETSGIPAFHQIVDNPENRGSLILKKVQQILTKPWRMTFFPQDFGGDQPKIGPLLLGLSPALITLRDKLYKVNPWRLYIFLFTLIFSLIWLIFFHNSRYLVPVFPLITIYLSAGIYYLWHNQPRKVFLINLLIIGALGFSTLITLKLHFNKITTWIQYPTPHQYYKNLKQPLTNGVRIEEYETSNYANYELNKNEHKILILEGLFGYFLEIPYERGRPDAQAKYDYTQITEPKQLLEIFEENEITHIMTRLPRLPNLAKRTDFSADQPLTLSEKSKRGFEVLQYDFLRLHTLDEFSANDIQLYRVVYPE